MREEDLVTPEWAKWWSRSSWQKGRCLYVVCQACTRRFGLHSDVLCPNAEESEFVLHRTDPAVNLQPGQTVEEVRRGYVQREDGSWHREAVRGEGRSLGGYVLLAPDGEVYVSGNESRSSTPEPPPEYTCAPGCGPANPCMSEEEYEKLAKLLDADTDVISKRKFVCRARHHLVVEAALAKLNAADGVADPVAKVKSPPVPGVRWNGRSAR